MSTRDVTRRRLDLTLRWLDLTRRRLDLTLQGLDLTRQGHVSVSHRCAALSVLQGWISR